MKKLYTIEIVNGIICYTMDYLSDFDDAPRSIAEYFRLVGQRKSTPIDVVGWPFARMYITQGTEENGCAIAMV